MLRRDIAPRQHWQALAQEYGFNFHTINGEPYWDESAYYQFTLEQVERDIEDPTQELTRCAYMSSMKSCNHQRY